MATRAVRPDSRVTASTGLLLTTTSVSFRFIHVVFPSRGGGARSDEESSESELLGLLKIRARALSYSSFPAAEAIWLTVPTSGERCVYEEIQANVVVVVDYLCIDEGFTQIGPTLDVRVTSPYGKELYKRANMTHGQAAFTTSEGGTYLACLSMHHDQTHHSVNNSFIVNLDWKMGIRAKDWDSVAKKEMIEGVDLQLRKSTEIVSAIRANILYLKIREAYMREINEKTNKRVAQLSGMSLGVSIIVSVIQVWYLKRFFLKKKLI